MTIKVGILGCGGIAGWAHAPAFQAIKGVKMVACSDKDAERAKAFAEKWCIPRHYTDYRQMLEQESLDVLSVCTPNYAHKEPTVLALKAGVHVICEKPMAMNARQAREMLEASRRSKALLTIAHQHRFTREAQALKRFIDAGELGNVYFVRSQALRRAGIPGWGEFHKKAVSGGGVLIDIGVHVIDLCLWLIGTPKLKSVSGAAFRKFGDRRDVEVVGVGDYKRSEFDVEDFAFGAVRFMNGAMMSIEASWAANIEEDTRITQQLVGEKGGATLYPFKIFTQRHGVLLDITPKITGEFNPYQAEMEWFIAAVRGEKELLVKPEECYVVQQIIDGIYESSRTQKEIYPAKKR